jgi:hypothetical protein
MPEGDKDKRKICCAFDAMRSLKQITVNGQRVAISNLEDIFEEARRHEPNGERAVRNELLRQAKAYNYIPESAEKAYEDALWREYKSTRCNTEGCNTCRD